ncbi:bacteriophage abortive infection AbiH family protein [Staphylococcus simulans]|uniref:Bacteriophage abortive infection AbiH n=5 Tax=Staphylococcus simulans TaxID=1286 RepID=A0ABP2YXI0_STASI|nr:AbiH family protein [Staphylococcus simulans]AVO00891.1 hypothetical protein BI282_00130 [Staphylococcus simulans]AVO03842.1 hypothetical protein BI283_00130 [Staphylococcus simulans]AWG17438.1 hypothetical protein A9958_00130 [Staphylococcus simulans]AWI00406.1 hypothetical protein A7X73_00130 [Staphylococcus simulans]ERS94691.1 hypothetical protein SSIM_00930 [Staphylococcus simulans UMC-CNS-990]
MNLYIIGNGFDIDHGIKSSYYDFKKYLKTSADDNANLFLNILEKSYTKDDDNLWKNLEENIGNLDLNSVIEESILNLIPAIEFTNYFSCFFKKWVNQIDINVEAKAYLQKLFDNQHDLFFTFNYTPTLEKLYNINEQNIKYIHVAKKGDFYEFGHKKNKKQNKISHINFGVNNNLEQQLVKDTENIFELNKNWFETLNNYPINDIYFYGFSFASIDLIYIRNILAHLSKNDLKNIYLYNFDNQPEVDYQNQEKILNKLLLKSRIGLPVKRFKM